MTIKELIRSPSDYDAHFKHMKNKTFMKELRTYIDEQVLFRQRYLFVNKKGSKVRVMCSHCGHQTVLKNVPKQRTEEYCEGCNSRLQVRNTKYANYKDQTYLEFIYFTQSSKSKDIIVAYQFGVRRIISDPYESFEEIKVEDEIREEARFYFEIGGTNRLMTYCRWGKEWSFRQSIYKPNSAQHYFRDYNDEQLLEVLNKSDTFKYFPKHLVQSCDGFNLLNLYTKYPNIELLAKIGLENLIKTKVNYQGKTYGTINWKGKTIQKMLKLNKSEIKDFKSNTKGDYRDLLAYQLIKKHGLNKDEEIDSMIELVESEQNKTELNRLIEIDKPSRMIKYLKTQKSKAPKVYWSFDNVLRDFKDMLSDMEKLSIEATKKTIYPKDLNRHHQNLSAQVKMVIDELNDKRIKQRAAELSKFNLTKGKFAIFPARSTDDLFKESKVLRHCVKNYAERYALGNTNIFLLRDKNNLEAPLYTLEINTEMNLVQCRGKDNISIKAGSEAEKVLVVFLKNLKTKNRSVNHERIAN